MARIEDVGAVAHNCQHAAVAQAFEGSFIGHLADYRVRIELPVARVQHGAERCFDGDTVGLGD